MQVHDALGDLFDRIPPLVRHAVDGLTADQLAQPPAPGANTIGWLVWHLTRVQDHHVAQILGEPQLWVEGTWAARCGLAPDPTNTGYGHTEEEVAAVRPDGPDVLVAYHDAVARRTGELVRRVTPAELERVIDERFDPPVTVGVRLVSVAADDLQHAGQAAYARGILIPTP
jgi:hypothetical protein